MNQLRPMVEQSQNSSISGAMHLQQLGGLGYQTEVQFLTGAAGKTTPHHLVGQA